MPRRNAMGPMGMGPMTGRGMGYCRPRGYDSRRVGFNCGYGRGMGRFNSWEAYPISTEDEKNFLKNEKLALETRLNEIGEMLNDFEE